MHDPLGILKVQAFAQEIRCDQDVGFERRRRPRCTLRARRERTQHLLTRCLSGRKPAGVAEHRGDAAVTKARQEMARGRLRVGEDDRLRRARAEELLKRINFGVSGWGTTQEIAQPRDDAAIPDEPCRAMSVVEQQWEQHELNVRLGGAGKAPLKFAW